MTVTIVNLDADGNGYCKVVADNGLTFGQAFRGLPVDDPTAFDAALAALIQEALARLTVAPVKVLHPTIVARIGKPVVMAPAAPVIPKP